MVSRFPKSTFLRKCAQFVVAYLLGGKSGRAVGILSCTALSVAGVTDLYENENLT